MEEVGLACSASFSASWDFTQNGWGGGVEAGPMGPSPRFATAYGGDSAFQNHMFVNK